MTNAAPACCAQAALGRLSDEVAQLKGKGKGGAGPAAHAELEKQVRRFAWSGTEPGLGGGGTRRVVWHGRAGRGRT